MNKNITINTDEYSTNSQKFDYLLKKGIEYIQKYSGEKWTDYNYHDPGITILEQLCYAITDLGYKSNFPIEDLLMINVDDFDYEKNNLFIPPEKIFYSNPNTINDLRKIIIDSVEEVNNVWIVNSNNNSYSNHGLLDFKVQLFENVNYESSEKILNKIKTIYYSNRILCTDINDIVVLNKDTISIGATIEIDSFCVGEQILAKLLVEIESRINKRIKFVGFEYFEDKKLSYDKIFRGVKTKNGIILDENLKPKTNEIYISELIEIIRDIDGVISVKDFSIYKNGIKIFSEIITFSDNSYPSFENIDTFFSKNSDSNISFIRNNTPYSIDKIIFTQIYDSISNEDSISLINNFKNNKIKKGRFEFDKLSKYYSFINEFPALYGLKEKELDPKSTPLRKAQMKQLKAFLILFDQVMANYNAQLSNIRNIFTIEKIDRTYFTKVPENISGFSELIDNNNLSNYKNQILNFSESKQEFFKRRNLFLDHLISRFGEEYNSKILENMYLIENPNSSSSESSSYAIDCKIRYAKNILELGVTRNKARNYSSNNGNNLKNISGLEKRLKLILDLKDDFDKISLGFDHDLVYFEEKDIWNSTNVKINNGPEIELLSLPENCYENNQVNFYLKNYSNFKDLFKNAIDKKSFNIIFNGIKYFLLFNSEITELPVKIFESSSKSTCTKKIIEIISKIQNLNFSTERLYVLENILLRPQIIDKYKMQVSYKGVPIFKSFKIFDFNKLSEIREDVINILKDRSNYSIHKSIKKYSISVFDVMNNKILTSNKLFKNRNDAKNEIELIIKNLSENSKFEIEIIAENKSLNKFPENFNYSNELNIIFPDWPSRFQNIEFKKYIREIIDRYIPANINFKLHFLNYFQIKNFTEIYSEWSKMKSKKPSPALDIASLKLIQFLIEINNE